MVEISASLLSVEKEKIIKTIYNLETAKINYFHIDVMDGEFVNNNTVDKMKEYCDYLTNITNIPLDIHLMVNNVMEYVDMFIPYNPNIITFHYEASTHIHRSVQMIKSMGIKAGVVLNPHTPVSVLEDILGDLDVVLLMSVNPGFGGQKFIENTIAKVQQLRQLIERTGSHALIEVDGGVEDTVICELCHGVRTTLEV